MKLLFRFSYSRSLRLKIWEVSSKSWNKLLNTLPSSTLREREKSLALAKYKAASDQNPASPMWSPSYERDEHHAQHSANANVPCEQDTHSSQLPIALRECGPKICEREELHAQALHERDPSS